MVTGAEGITGLVLVSALVTRASRPPCFIRRHGMALYLTELQNTQNYRLSLPARQTEPPRWLIAIPGKVVKTLAISFTWLSALNDCANSHASNLTEVLHQGEKASQLLQRLTRMRCTGR